MQRALAAGLDSSSIVPATGSSCKHIGMRLIGSGSSMMQAQGLVLQAYWRDRLLRSYRRRNGARSCQL